MKYPGILFFSILLISCDSNRPASYEYADSTTVRKHSQVNPRDSGTRMTDTSKRDSVNLHRDTTNHQQKDKDSIQ